MNKVRQMPVVLIFDARITTLVSKGRTSTSNGRFTPPLPRRMSRVNMGIFKNLLFSPALCK
jgi:hypothetical protein